MIEEGKIYKLKAVKFPGEDAQDDYKVLKVQADGLCFIENLRTGDGRYVYTDALVDPVEEDMWEKLNTVMKPMNLTFWKDLQEEASFGSLGAAPTPALTSGCVRGTTVYGIAVEGQSVKYKKKKKSKKHEEACKPLFNPYKPTEEDKDFATIEKRVTPEEMLDWIDETFDPSWVLVTTVQNSRELMKISVCYDEPGYGMLHNMKIEYLDIDGETVIDEVDEEGFNIGECIEELQNIFRTHKPVDVEMYEDMDLENTTEDDEIKALLIKAQAEENDAIASYLEKANKCKQLGNDPLEKLFKELADDETVHIGCLQGTLDKLGISDLDKIIDGHEEAEEILDDEEDDIIWNIEEDFHEAYERITGLLAKQLDRMNFEFANTEEIIYKKEGKYKYLLKFDNENGILKFKVSQDDNTLVEKEWELEEKEDVTPIFQEIEDIYNKYGI